MATIACDAGPRQDSAASPAVTDLNEAAAEANSEARPSQAAAAVNSGPDPAPTNIRAEIISGGNDAKFDNIARPLRDHS
ncbi:hypothetical protein MLAC_45370 [Mycobacterium lacus]|uniref:Uncharacterized protein n=1 Tax=Mycobacterium lacus TaxID=169765 RepID=A0A7I7NSL7_9MYCO|nr:hypothetical protein MLAC_45370 [Mycobacterium lacus]